MELGFMELMPTAAIICDEVLKAKPGEKIVITADSRNHEYPGQEPMIEALMAAMAERGLDPTMVYYEGRYLSSPKIPEIAALTLENADIVIGENSVLLLQSQAMQMMMANNHTRVLLLPSGINITWSPDEIYRLMPRNKEELQKTSELMNRVGDKLKGTPSIHFSAVNGTDMTLELFPWPMHHDDGIAIHDGYCDKPGKLSILPEGSIVCTSKDGTVNGKLVLDAEMSLYDKVLPDAATLYFKDGIITSIEGDGMTANMIREYLDAMDPTGVTNMMGEFGLGFNPKAKLNGNSSEGESLYGAVHIGVGYMGQDHFDAVVPCSSIEINGEAVLKDGEYL